jgi:TPR repeat protein
MNIPRFFYLVGIALTILLLSSKFAFAQVIDGPIARSQLERQVSNLLYQEKFDALEKMAQDLRTTKAKFPDGFWKLYSFYEGLSRPKNGSSDGWKRFLSKFDRWIQKYPDSITARTAAGSGWMKYGWAARGSGYVNTVNEEGWRLLDDRIKKAYSFLEKKPVRLSDDCPERYDLLLNLATAQGWDRPQYEALFHEAITLEPSYISYYVDKAGYLQPKWHGEEGEWQKFAKDAVKLAPESEGNSVYMHIILSLWEDKDRKSFGEVGISWDIMKQGFIDTERNFPNSPWNLNNFCKFACIAGDKETARMLFKRIGDRPYIEAWSDVLRVSEYKKWRDWALSDNKPGDKSEKPLFPRGTEDFQEMMLLAKEGDPEAQYKIGSFYLQGELVVKDNAEGVKWIRKAAEQGHREAQSSLAGQYFGTQPIETDSKESPKWYYIAAMQGDSNAASLLGYMYYNGFRLEKDNSKAFIWYSLVTQWKDPHVKEIAAKLTQEQLNQAELELKRIREEIRINEEAAEIRILDASTIKIPTMAYKELEKIQISPPAKLPAGNLLEGVKWQSSGGAQVNEKTLSIKNGGNIETLIKVDPIFNGCMLVGARIRHSRPVAIVGGAPFFMGNLVYQGQDSTPIGMRLLVSPTVKEKEGPWFQVKPISSLFDGIKIRFGTAGTKEDEKKGSSTEFSDIRVMIFPTCEGAKAAGASFYKP